MAAPIDEHKTALLGYPDIYVTVSETSESEKYDVHITPGMDNSKCPRCGVTAQARGDHKLKKLDYVIEGGEVSFIDVNLYRRRFFCPKCAAEKSESGNQKIVPCFSEKVPMFPKESNSQDSIYDERKKTSTRLARYIYFLYCGGKPLKNIGEALGLTFYPISEACKDSHVKALQLDDYPCPTRVFMKELVVNGHPNTILCDVDQHTVVFFAEEPAGKILDSNYIKRQKAKSVSAVAEHAAQKRKAILEYILSNAKTVVVDADCRFISSLKAQLGGNCTITTDLEELYQRLYARFETAAYLHLQTSRAKKLLKYVPRNFTYLFTNQKEYSFLGRALDESSELSTIFSALNSFRSELGRSTIGDDNMPISALTGLLQSWELLAPELAGNLFQPPNRETSFILKECRDFMEFLTDELEKVPRKHSSELVEGKFYYCVPRCYKYTAGLADNSDDSKRIYISSFESPWLPEKGPYLGRTFDCIIANVRYREDVLNGSASYAGPDIC